MSYEECPGEVRATLGAALLVGPCSRPAGHPGACYAPLYRVRLESTTPLDMLRCRGVVPGCPGCPDCAPRMAGAAAAHLAGQDAES